MTRLATISLAAALICGWTARQDMGGGMGATQEEKACDVAKSEPRDYCAGCKIWPASDQVDKGACKTCKGKVEKVETCVKSCWVCPKMHDGKPKRHEKDCCGMKGCCKETPILAIVSYACDGCKAAAAKEADVKHTGEKCAGKIQKVCSESTKFPHGGTEG